MKRGLPLLLLITIGCQPSGCSRPTPTPTALPTITDDLGRSVSLPKSPERIVSLSPAATEILFAIGAGPKVVAGTDFDTYPEEAKQLPRVGGFTPQSINAEAILAHKPDLVVAAPQKDVIAALEKFNIPVVALDPKTIDDVWNNIRLLGRLTDSQSKASEVATRARGIFLARNVAAGNTNRPRVLFVLADEPLITAGQGTFIDEIITTAGGESVFADVADSWPKISDEQVLARGVDVILCVEHVGGDGSIVPGRLKKRPGWDKLKAVRDGKVYVVDADLVVRPGPRLVDGLEAVRKLLK
ncbi:MAG: cobalamin-binding protein [Fimbriiglobus sp.]|jgi:iron complex transport system substrate-binding protein|nr:cobalamin-binding protein [Fimbriiglobus sp.]